MPKINDSSVDNCIKVIESISNNSDVEYTEGILESMTNAVSEVLIYDEKNGSKKTPKSGPRVNLLLFYFLFFLNSI